MMPRRVVVPVGGVMAIVGVALTMALDGGLFVLGVVIALAGGMLLARAREDRLGKGEGASSSGIASAIQHHEHVPELSTQPQPSNGPEPTMPPFPPAA
jgi:hypothetical protein